MLLISKNSFGQTNEISSLRGIADSLVVVDTATIREATIKLLEREELKEIVAQQDTIINNKDKIIQEYTSYNIYLADENLKLKDSYNEVEEVNKKLQKSINRKNTGLWILGTTTATSIIINILFIFGTYGK